MQTERIGGLLREGRSWISQIEEMAKKGRNGERVNGDETEMSGGKRKEEDIGGKAEQKKTNVTVKRESGEKFKQNLKRGSIKMY